MCDLLENVIVVPKTIVFLKGNSMGPIKIRNGGN